MLWPSPLIPARLRRRYKRFLADVELDNGKRLTVHCPNTGAMTGCDEPGSRVWLSHSDNPKRKYPHTWQLVEVAGQRICIHSALANTLVAEALDDGIIGELASYQRYRREQRLEAGSRVDFLLSGGNQADCALEVKSVTLHVGGGEGRFPDAVSLRARRHVQELQARVESGQAAALLFAVLHEGIDSVAPAADIDPVYAAALAAAASAGVRLLAYRAGIDPVAGMRLSTPLPLRL